MDEKKLTDTLYKFMKDKGVVMKKKHCVIEQQRMDEKCSFYALKVEYKDCLTDIIFALFNTIPKLMICNWTYENEGILKHCVDFGLLLSNDRGADIKERIEQIEGVVTNIVEGYLKRKNMTKMKFIKGSK